MRGRRQRHGKRSGLRTTEGGRKSGKCGQNATLLAYSSIPAPLTELSQKRYSDTGALVQAGTNSDTQAMPVVDIAEDDILRLIFPR